MADNYEFRELTSAPIWEEYVLSADNYSFLQSWQFGELHKQLGNQVSRYGLFARETPVLLSQLILVNARRGRVTQLRHAPLFLPGFVELSNEDKKLALTSFLAKLEQHARAAGCDFIRLQARTNAENTESLLHSLGEAGYQPANIHNIDAEKTLLLDITKSEAELLEGMRKNTRYYIRRAEKDGVTVSNTTDLAAVKTFYAIHRDTTVRQQFKSYTEQYYLDFVGQLNSLADSALRAEVFLADYQGKTIAAAIIVFMGQRAFYSDGGSLTEYAKIPASYLIQWRALQRAKELGCTSYDFWGGVVPAETEGKSYPWAGIDLFKRGFGGEHIEYMHAQDLGLGWKYPLTRAFEWFEKQRRGY